MSQPQKELEDSLKTKLKSMKDIHPIPKEAQQLIKRDLDSLTKPFRSKALTPKAVFRQLP